MVQCLIEQDEAPPALIHLHFIGLDGLSYNCIRALTRLTLPSTPSPSLSTTETTCHRETPGEVLRISAFSLVGRG